MEVHPAGWLDGIDTPGNLGGIADASPPGDMISLMMIGWGEMGTEYNFGELLPGSIRGQVVMLDRSRLRSGRSASRRSRACRSTCSTARATSSRSTLTDANGEYEFTDLRPGEYAVREHQPTGYFDLDAHVGDGGGTRLSTNLLGDIDVGSGRASHELRLLRGAAGGALGLRLPRRPADRHATTRSRRSRSPRSATATARATTRRSPASCSSSATAPTARRSPATWRCRAPIGDGPIRTTTDANGFYHFAGLRAGTYAVVQVHPSQFIDGRDMPGLLGRLRGESDRHSRRRAQSIRRTKSFRTAFR